MDETTSFPKTESGQNALVKAGPTTSYLTSKLTGDCFIVHDPSSNGALGWKFTNGGKRENRKGEIIVTMVCSGCRAIYDRAERDEEGNRIHQ